MTTLAQNQTNINIIPQRIAADHYQTASFTDPNKTYDQIYDYDLKRWICNCPNATEGHNPNCKHNILLRAFIKKEKDSQQHSSSAELIQILTRIANLEGAVRSIETENHLVERDLEEHQYQLTTRSDQETMLKQQLAKQQEQIDRLEDIIGTLQSQICKLNERTINQDVQIQKQKASLQDYIEMAEEERLKVIEQQRTIEDQAQQIDKLYDQISQQARPSEQIVRVVVDQPPAPRQTREASEAQDTNVRPVKDESGKVTSCKVGKFTVPVKGNSAAGCDCSIGIMDRQCPHMIKVDQFLSK